MIVENMFTASSMPEILYEIKKATTNQEQKKLPESPVINDIVLQNPIPDDSALIEKTRRLWGLNDDDNVQIFVVDFEQFRRMRFTNFVTRPTTSRRLERLNNSVSSNRRQVQDLQRGLADPELNDSERARKIALLEQDIKRDRRAATRER
ncbi:MAG: hypothetical protein FWF78_00155, partial [Defluviitaleaceae bacterium]|nr:hypothetical protein [Defluviitaleaceae bacterium]